MPPIGPEHAQRAATIARCIHVLEHGLVRARAIAGWRWPSADETPSLAPKERQYLGELLDALHNVRKHLADLFGEATSPHSESALDQAFRTFDELYARTPSRAEVPRTISLADRESDDGHARLDHEK